MMVKLLYLILFLSIDVLLYLRLGRKIAKTGKLLIIASTVWLIVLALYLPMFHLVYLLPLSTYINCSGMILQLIFVHYVGRFVIFRVERSHQPDFVKQYMNRVISFSFNTAIFGFYVLAHLIFILISVV
jgi:hypothetical protein